MPSKQTRLLFLITGIVIFVMLIILFYAFGWKTYCEKSYERSMERDYPATCPRICAEKFFETYDPKTELTAFGYECIPRR